MIRAAEPEDAGRLAEIHVFGWRSAYRGLVPDEHLFQKMQVSRRAQGFREAIRNREEETAVFVEDGILKAFATWGPSRDEDKPGAFELWGIYVDPGFQRQGIGRRLVGHAVETARARGHGEISLWVFQANEASRHFYESVGFSPGRENQDGFLGAPTVRYTRSTTSAPPW